MLLMEDKRINISSSMMLLMEDIYLKVVLGVDPAFLAIMCFPLKRRDSFFLFFLKNHFLENGLESPLIFVLF